MKIEHIKPTDEQWKVIDDKGIEIFVAEWDPEWGESDEKEAKQAACENCKRPNLTTDMRQLEIRQSRTHWLKHTALICNQCAAGQYKIKAYIRGYVDYVNVVRNSGAIK